MATGSEFPKLLAASEPADGQTASAARMVPPSPAHREALKSRESPSDREQPNDRIQSQGPERQTAPRAESDRIEPASTERVCWGLNGGDRRFLTVISAVALILTAVHWFRITQQSPAPVAVDRSPGERYRFVLDANRANWVEWMQLEGIGETLARRIVADREQNGPFPDVGALDRVPGIGPKTLARIRADVVVREVAARDVLVREAHVPEQRLPATSDDAD